MEIGDCFAKDTSVCHWKQNNKHKTITNVFRHECMYACMNSGSMSKGEIHRQTAAKQAAYTHIREREREGEEVYYPK